MSREPAQVHLDVVVQQAHVQTHSRAMGEVVGGSDAPPLGIDLDGAGGGAAEAKEDTRTMAVVSMGRSGPVQTDGSAPPPER